MKGGTRGVVSNAILGPVLARTREGEGVMSTSYDAYKVVIEVRGGVATIIMKPVGVEITIIDRDIEETTVYEALEVLP